MCTFTTRLKFSTIKLSRRQVLSFSHSIRERIGPIKVFNSPKCTDTSSLQVARLMADQGPRCAIAAMQHISAHFPYRCAFDIYVNFCLMKNARR